MQSDDDIEIIDPPMKKDLSNSTTIVRTKEEELNQTKDLLNQIQRQTELLELKHRQNQQSQQEVVKLREQIDDRELKLVQVMKEKQQLQTDVINQTEIANQFIQKEDQLNSEIYAYKLTIEQYEQNLKIAKNEIASLVQREQKQKEELDSQRKLLRTNEDKVKQQSQIGSNQIQQLQKDNEALQQKLKDQIRLYEQSNKQNSELIAELIEQRNQNFSNSVYGKQATKEELDLNKQNEVLKAQTSTQAHRIEVLEASIVDLQNKVTQLSRNLAEKDNLISLLDKKKKVDDELISKLQQEKTKCEALLEQNHGQLEQYKQQIGKLQQLSIMRSQVGGQEEKLQKELQQKNEAIAMLQNENHQLVKLIETLKAQKIDNQGADSQRVKVLELELKNIQQFVYDSPLVVLFNLLEDRLSKQQQKSFQNKKNIKEFWTNTIKQWEEGFIELQQAFQGVKIQFKFEILYLG
ncbi:hypothetical protein pb186bvf_005215 [Paramecium bursaria]